MVGIMFKKYEENISRKIVIDWYMSTLSSKFSDQLLKELLWIDSNIEGMWYAPAAEEILLKDSSFHNKSKLVFFQFEEDLVLFKMVRK